MSPLLKLEALKQSLNKLEGFEGYEVCYLEQTASTNNILKAELALNKPIKRVVIANSQTAGRGQFNKKWLNKPGQALIFSFSLVDYKNEFPLTLTLGAAMFCAIQGFAGKHSGLWLKWPNDIWFNKGKLAGMLCESSFCGAEQKIAAGIGVNLLPLDDISVKSSSLSDFCKNTDRFDLSAEFFKQFSRLSKMTSKELVGLWKACAGQFFKIKFEFILPNQTSFVGSALDITPNGALIALNDKTQNKTALTSASLVPHPSFFAAG